MYERAEGTRIAWGWPIDAAATLLQRPDADAASAVSQGEGGAIDAVNLTMRAVSIEGMMLDTEGRNLPHSA